MEHRIYLSILFVFVFFRYSDGQMIIGPDTLVGNEWIRYNQTYYKFSVDHDGVFRITKGVLESAGLLPSSQTGSQFRIYNMGRQVPLFVSTDGEFGDGDFIEFYGHRNRSELDQYLFKNPDNDLLNPDHSLYSDSNPYFLTVEGSEIPLRVNQVNNDLSNPPAAGLYYLHKESINFHDEFHDPYFPVAGGGSVSYSSYMHGEGFTRQSENISLVSIPSPNRYPAAPDATLHLRMTTTNYGPHSFLVSLNNQTIGSLTITDLRLVDTTYTLPVSMLSDVNELKVTAENTQSRHSIVAVDLIYGRTPALPANSEASLILPGQPGSQHFALSGFPHQGNQPVIYTHDGLQRMMASIDVSDQVEFNWPETSDDLLLHITDVISGIGYIPAVEQKQFTDYTADDTEYIIITHPSIMEVGTGSEFVQYRSSVEGGSYRAKAYNILDLYDQFGYGIEKHPQAVRNFVEFFDRNWPSAEMIFIVGRAIEYYRSRYPGGWEAGFFVPTFGRPGSDNLLAATVWDLVPRFPIGRLAVVDEASVSVYLDKVKEHDASRLAPQTIDDKAWMKNLMHLGGGKTAIEQNDFKMVLGSLSDDLVFSDFGAKAHFFQKESTDIIGESQSAQILALLNEGCGIINYLGHSASTTFEFNINDPNEWNNHGRYPVFSAMGCSAGQIHGTLLSLSDNYVQTANEGAIAFISGSGSQFASALVQWARPWYDFIGDEGYGEPLGASVLHGLRGVGNFVNPDFTGSNQYRYLLEQQTLQGDPALRFHPMPGPDYLVDRSSVSISPEILNTKLDSFDVRFSIANIGRNVVQDVPYIIKIRKPDGSEILIEESQVTADQFESIITARLPLDTDGKAGSFRLLVHVDPDNLLTELPTPAAEDNNILKDNLGVEGIEFFVVDNLISAVYPPNYGIVTNTNPELIATSSNSFIKRQNIVIEIDTTALFNSEVLLREKFINHSATLKWTPSYNFTPEQVYYWRVSTDSVSPEQGFLWSKRSFLYKPGSPNGWNQSHFHQLTDNLLDRLLADSLKQDFLFNSISQNFTILNRVEDPILSLIPMMRVDNIIRAAYFTNFRNTEANVFVVAIDSLTGQPMRNPNPGLYGSMNHLSFDAPAFAYRSDNADSRQAMINFIENVIPAGHYVFFYTYQRPGHMDYFPEQWEGDEATFGKSIYSVIESQFPSSNIRTLATTGSVPYVVFFQKDRGGIQELIAADSSDVISMSWDGGISLYEGTFVSTLIGPASRWQNIQHQIITHTDTAGTTSLSAWAMDKTFTDTLWISHHLTQADTNISAIDARQYPYIQLAVNTSDSAGYNPANILYWRVLFDGYPEFIINPDIGYEYEADSLMQGETMKLTTHVENVSDYAADSLPVSLRIISEDNTTQELLFTISHIEPHTSVPVEFEKVTSEMGGQYRVLMDVNSGQSIPENDYNNNIGILPLFVERDGLNPVLDVTFDGLHILDGDLVASRPLIAIRLHDENQFLRLDDTSSFAIFLKYPSELQPRRISFDEDWITFQPAGTGQNIAMVEMQPELLEDGIYTLQVKAKDATGNFAGDNDYLITFEVINAKSVSHLYNYPNPFSTSTRFVYTLTGDGSPPYYKIQIMSLTGRVVREITQAELGPLVVGTHMTDYVWDGTDELGGKLAAGTYLYRMIVKDEELNDFDHYETSGDTKFFNKGWGKLVILR